MRKSRMFGHPMTRAQKILNAVVILPPDSEVESSSDESEGEILNIESDYESDAPSIDSAMQEIMEELYDCHSGM